MYRIDGRLDRELRAISCDIGCYPTFDGSALFSQGNTQVLATVSGPKQCRIRNREKRDRAIIQVQIFFPAFCAVERKKSGRYDHHSKEVGLEIKNVLESLVLLEIQPRSQIDVNISVIQSDGGVKCASINASVLALIDAGIPLKGVLAACAAGYVNDKPVLDMNRDEHTFKGADVPVALLTPISISKKGQSRSKTLDNAVELLKESEDEILLVESNAQLSAEQFNTVMALAMDGCKQIAEYMKQKVRAHGSKLLADIETV
ncbi:MAG: putative Exosome complex component RRP41 [Streblomastix strix]|uniref:Putative Exosome complex component RRP41 n=1 Tax=Streblomastix strix TaxID=222440 RepID=A0A5J4X4U9_9EUKA|nr:MAG: putative Exosome complex component RRP41 [Streblomastix strix]